MNNINITLDHGKCTRTTVTVRELIKNFVDNAELGVTALDGNLCVRPAYQREFVYDTEDSLAVIDSILNGIPLGLMYWHDKEDGTFDVIDGQQRTMSICQFAEGKHSVYIDGIKRNFKANFPPHLREQFLNFEIDVCKFVGNESQVIRLFRRINTTGKALFTQEIRNSAYTGEWLTSAKEHFSRTNCPADDVRKPYIKAITNRQELLECALYWASGCSNDDGENARERAKIHDDKIMTYMSEHRGDKDASELWNHFMNVITWVENVTSDITHRELIELSGKWGELYTKYANDFVINKDEIITKVKDLSGKEWVMYKGIFPYIISGDLREINPRHFDKKMKAKKYKEQKGICPMCGKKYKEHEMEADHVKPYKDGGITEYSNLQVLCKDCNQRKGSGVR